MTISEQDDLTRLSDQQIASTFAIGRKNLFVRNKDTFGKMRIDGRVSGDLHARSFFLGQGGSVTGNIFAENAFIYGRVQGCIFAQSINLFPSSRVRGALLQRRLVIEAGADFEGYCLSLTANPQASAVPASRLTQAAGGDAPQFKK